MEQLLPNYFADGMRAAALGKQNRDANAYRTVASQAYGAAPEQRNALIQQAVGIDPTAGMALGRSLDAQDDDVTSKAAGAARYVLSQTDPAARAGAYRAVVPFLTRIGAAHGKVPPAEYSPDMDAQMHELIAMGEGAGKAGGGVQSSYIDGDGNRVALMRDGRHVVIGTADIKNQVMDTGNGIYGVNTRTLQANPVMVGGAAPSQQPPPTPFIAPDGAKVMIDPSLPASVQAEIRASEAGGQIPPSQLNIPPQGGPQQPAQGTMLQSGLKPNEAAHLQLSQNADRRDAERLRLAQNAADGGGDSAPLSNAAIDNAATRYNITGTIPPLGMGKAAAAQRSHILTRAAELASGQSATDLAMQPADYKNTQATLKGLQQSSASMARATEALHSNAKLMLDASNKVFGSSWTGTRLENEARLAYGRQANDPSVAAYEQYTTTVANEYAKIIGGAPGSNAASTEGARKAAEDAIHKAASPEALKAVVDSLYSEAENFRNSIDGQTARLRAELSGAQNRRSGDQPAVRRATNPKTGEVVELRNGQWVPAR